MLNIRRLKNKNIIQNSLYNINDNSNVNINHKSNSFVKKRKNRLSYDQNSKISRMGYKFSTNTTYGEEFISKNKKNNFSMNKSPTLNKSLNKKKISMTLSTINKIDETKKKIY
jgi:hypothetical protein